MYNYGYKYGLPAYWNSTSPTPHTPEEIIAGARCWYNENGVYSSFGGSWADVTGNEHDLLGSFADAGTLNELRAGKIGSPIVPTAEFEHEDEIEIWMTARHPSGTTGGGAYCTWDGGLVRILFATTVITASCTNGTSMTTSTSATTTKCIRLAMKSGGVAELWSNGVLIDTKTNWTPQLYLGFGISPASSPHLFGEIGVTNPLSDDDAITMMTYLVNKWGCT